MRACCMKVIEKKTGSGSIIKSVHDFIMTERIFPKNFHIELIKKQNAIQTSATYGLIYAAVDD